MNLVVRDTASVTGCGVPELHPCLPTGPQPTGTRGADRRVQASRRCCYLARRDDDCVEAQSFGSVAEVALRMEQKAMDVGGGLFSSVEKAAQAREK